MERSAHQVHPLSYEAARTQSRGAFDPLAVLRAIASDPKSGDPASMPNTVLEIQAMSDAELHALIRSLEDGSEGQA